MPKRMSARNVQATEKLEAAGLYILERRHELLRYITAALCCSVLRFMIERLSGATGSGLLLPYAVWFFAMFYTLKYWVYKEKGSGFFYTGRQLMLAVMGVIILTIIFQYAIIFLVSLGLNGRLASYLMRFLAELAYYFFFQFFIFREPK